MYSKKNPRFFQVSLYKPLQQKPPTPFRSFSSLAALPTTSRIVGPLESSMVNGGTWRAEKPWLLNSTRLGKIDAFRKDWPHGRWLLEKNPHRCFFLGQIWFFSCWKRMDSKPNFSLYLGRESKKVYKEIYLRTKEDLTMDKLFHCIFIKQIPSSRWSEVVL